jgi:hypothetical protein
MAKKAAAPKVEKKAPRVKVTGFAPMNFKDHTITQKRSGRYQVVTAKGKAVNGAEKEKILLDAKVLKGSFKKSADAPAAT